MTLYEWLDTNLKEQGRSKKWLSEKLGIKYTTLTSYGKQSHMPVKILVNVAKILELNLEELKNVDFDNENI